MLCLCWLLACLITQRLPSQVLHEWEFRLGFGLQWPITYKALGLYHTSKHFDSMRMHGRMRFGYSMSSISISKSCSGGFLGPATALGWGLEYRWDCVLAQIDQVYSFRHFRLIRPRCWHKFDWAELEGAVFVQGLQSVHLAQAAWPLGQRSGPT